MISPSWDEVREILVGAGAATVSPHVPTVVLATEIGVGLDAATRAIVGGASAPLDPGATVATSVVPGVAAIINASSTGTRSKAEGDSPLGWNEHSFVYLYMT